MAPYIKSHNKWHLASNPTTSGTLYQIPQQVAPYIKSHNKWHLTSNPTHSYDWFFSRVRIRSKSICYLCHVRPSVCLSACNSWAPTWRIFAKFYIGGLKWKRVRRIVNVVPIGQKYRAVLCTWVRFVVAGDTKSPWGQEARQCKMNESLLCYGSSGYGNASRYFYNEKCVRQKL